MRNQPRRPYPASFYPLLEIVTPGCLSSNQLNELIEQTKSMTEHQPTPGTNYVALIMLTGTTGFVALGPEDWRQWADTRGAWSFLASQIYRLKILRNPWCLEKK